MEPLKWRNIHDLYTTDTSLIRTLCSVPSVSVLERFDCMLIFLTYCKFLFYILNCIVIIKIDFIFLFFIIIIFLVDT